MFKVTLLFLCVMAFVYSPAIAHYILITSGLARKRHKLNRFEKELRDAKAGKPHRPFNSIERQYLDISDELDFEIAMVNLRKPYPELHKEKKKQYKKLLITPKKYGKSKVTELTPDSMSWKITHKKRKNYPKTMG